MFQLLFLLGAWVGAASLAPPKRHLTSECPTAASYFANGPKTWVDVTKHLKLTVIQEPTSPRSLKVKWDVLDSNYMRQSPNLRTTLQIASDEKLKRGQHGTFVESVYVKLLPSKTPRVISEKELLQEHLEPILGWPIGDKIEFLRNKYAIELIPYHAIREDAYEIFISSTLFKRITEKYPIDLNQEQALELTGEKARLVPKPIRVSSFVPEGMDFDEWLGSLSGDEAEDIYVKLNKMAVEQMPDKSIKSKIQMQFPRKIRKFVAADPIYMRGLLKNLHEKIESSPMLQYVPPPLTVKSQEHVFEIPNKAIQEFTLKKITALKVIMLDEKKKLASVKIPLKDIKFSFHIPELPNQQGVSSGVSCWGEKSLWIL